MARKKMVFLVSEKNSCRSIIAQAYLLKHGFDHFDCQSFGLKPDRIHYLVQEVLQERGFNSTFYFSKGFDMVKHQPVDIVIHFIPRFRLIYQKFRRSPVYPMELRRSNGINNYRV